jgi:hypothetical protein
VEDGSAVLSGVSFDPNDPDATPLLTGSNSTLQLDSPSELWVGGSVASSATMTLKTGGKTSTGPVTSTRFQGVGSPLRTRPRNG